jgi:hypothetical protein
LLVFRDLAAQPLAQSPFRRIDAQPRAIDAEIDVETP